MAMWIIIIIIVVVLTLLFAAGNFFFRMAIKPGVFAKFMERRKKTDDSGDTAEPIVDEPGEWWDGMPVQVLKMTSHDGYRLQGYYIKNGVETNRLAVLIHGYYGRAREMAIYARIYYEMGFDVFAADNRGHGESEGKAIGMGWLDRLDYMNWLKLLIEKNANPPDIIIHGHSMGGATACLLSGEILPPCVKGIISDCAYDSVSKVLAYQLKNLFKLPVYPLLPIASLICRIRAGYFFGSGNVAANVAKCRTPVLFIHGDQDTFVPFEMVDSLYAAADPAFREKWVVEGAKHIESVMRDTGKYAERVKAFVSRAIN